MATGCECDPGSIPYGSTRYPRQSKLVVQRMIVALELQEQALDTKP